jgi:hypothetical protein
LCWFFSNLNLLIFPVVFDDTQMYCVIDI